MDRIQMKEVDGPGEVGWPEWLVWAQAYTGIFRLGIRPNRIEEAKNWCGTVFDPRYDRESDSIILESISGADLRTLQVIFEEADDQSFQQILIPTFARPVTRWRPKKWIEEDLPQPLPDGTPPIVAFHSFKGGVGRTAHALALATAISRYPGAGKPLLVDADLEAPGITWLLPEILPVPPISFSDLLVFAHGEGDTAATATVRLTADRLQNTILDGIFVLPAFRSLRQFSSLEIRPEHLIEGAENPFLLTDILGALGRHLNASAVVVDLRAGLSELSAGVILDPRVHRVFVTTLSGQSVDGTCRLLEIISEHVKIRREKDPVPALIFSQIPPDEHHGEFVLERRQRVLQAAEKFLRETPDGDLNTEQVYQVEALFDLNLLALPHEWERVFSRIEKSGLVQAMSPLLVWSGLKGSRPGPANHLANQRRLKKERTSLNKLAKDLEYAETNEIEDFLPTRPLRRLASDHRAKVPVAVVVGAKGSGKTFTFLQLIRTKTWTEFTDKALTDKALTDTALDARLCPFLQSANLRDSHTKDLLNELRADAAGELGSAKSMKEISEIRDCVREALRTARHEGEWRTFWLDLMAWSIGFEPDGEGAGRRMVQDLQQRDKHLIFLIDGLEDLFQDPADNASERTALRALLQEAPEWLEQQPGRPVGLVVFVRRDMVFNSVSQNAAQLIARHDPYALKWNFEEALRLVTWIAKKAEIPLIEELDRLHSFTEEELTDILVYAWGAKMGRDSSREARSAQWVLYALSDFQGQIQARDLVRLLRLAAEVSISDTYWTDRVLTPTGIRKALPKCSEEKILEIELENQQLKQVFKKLKAIDQEKKRIPFTIGDAGLTSEDVKTMEQNGALLKEKEDCFMPEIFRLGLGFNLKSGRRR